MVSIHIGYICYYSKSSENVTSLQISAGKGSSKKGGGTELPPQVENDRMTLFQHELRNIFDMAGTIWVALIPYSQPVV